MKIPSFYQALSEFESGQYASAYIKFVQCAAKGNVIAPHYIDYIEVKHKSIVDKVFDNATSTMANETSTSSSTSSTTQSLDNSGSPRALRDRLPPLSDYPTNLCQSKDWLATSKAMLALRQANSQGKSKRGKSDEKKRLKAIKGHIAHLKSLAAGKLSHAHYLLAKLYRTGEFVAKDVKNSLNHLANAIEYCHIAALYEIKSDQYDNALQKAAKLGRNLPTIVDYVAEKRHFLSQTVINKISIAEAASSLPRTLQMPAENRRRRRYHLLGSSLGDTEYMLFTAHNYVEGDEAESAKWSRIAAHFGSELADEITIDQYDPDSEYTSEQINEMMQAGENVVDKLRSSNESTDLNAKQAHLVHKLMLLYFNHKLYDNKGKLPYIQFAEQHNRKIAHHILGHIYSRGLAGCEIDNTKGIGSYERAAEQDSYPSILELAKGYHDGHFGAAPDHDKAKQYYLRMTAFNECPPSVYWDLASVSSDESDKQHYLDIATQKEYPKAIQYRVKQLIESDNQSGEQHGLIKGYLKKLTKHPNVDVSIRAYAHGELGRACLAELYGIKSNLREAMRHLLKSVELRPGAFTLACLGQCYTVMADEQPSYIYKAIEVYKQALELDPENRVALSSSAILRWHGNCVEQDRLSSQAALEMLIKAGELGLCVGYFNAGFIYRMGAEDCDPDLEKAIHYFNKAIQLGDIDAYYELYICHKFRGEHELMMQSLRQGANAGNAQCQHNLGVYYLQESYTHPEGSEEAIRLQRMCTAMTRKAADSGNAFSMFQHAFNLLEDEANQQSNFEQAMAYLKRSAKLNFPIAKAAYNVLAPHKSFSLECLPDILKLYSQLDGLIFGDRLTELNAFTISRSNITEKLSDDECESQEHLDDSVVNSKAASTAHSDDNQHGQDQQVSIPGYIHQLDDVPIEYEEPAPKMVSTNDREMSAKSSYQAIAEQVKAPTAREQRLRERIDRFMDSANKKQVTMREFLSLVNEMSSSDKDYINRNTKSSRIKIRVDDHHFSIHEPHRSGRSKNEKLDHGRIHSMRGFIDKLSTSSQISNQNMLSHQ